MSILPQVLGKPVTTFGAGPPLPNDKLKTLLILLAGGLFYVVAIRKGKSF